MPFEIVYGERGETSIFSFTYNSFCTIRDNFPSGEHIICVLVMIVRFPIWTDIYDLFGQEANDKEEKRKDKN